MSASRLGVGPDSSDEETAAAVRAWVAERVPAAWREAADRGGPSAVRTVRSREEYEAWYPEFAGSGLVVPTWLPEYGGLGLPATGAQAAEAVLAPYNLRRLNPLGLSQAASSLFAFGTHQQRLRYLPPIVRNEERWCQLFSEPGAGSDLAGLATRAVLDEGTWVVDGQKVWTTWAQRSDLAVLLARTDPDVPKRRGLTFFLVDLRQPGIHIRPLRDMSGEEEFNEVFLSGARIPDAQRVGPVGEGWAVAAATLAGERHMVSGEGGGVVGRIGGGGARHVAELARAQAAVLPGTGSADPRVRQRVVALIAEERIRGWTNRRGSEARRAGQAAGPESSIGKVHQSGLNQRVQLAAVDVLGPQATAWAAGPATPDADGSSGAANSGSGAAGDAGYAADLPFEVRGMLRSRANSIEGGTTEVNKNVLGERVLGLPREPDPYRDTPWRDVPRS